MTPSAAGAIHAMAFVTDEADADDLLHLAIHRGATPEEARVARDEWRRLQAATVTTIHTTGGETR